MSQPNKPVILGVDEDRVAQVRIARAFNEQAVFYRFITDRRKVASALQQLQPDLLLVSGEVNSDFVITILDTLAQDVSWSTYPVALMAKDTADAPFVAGLRTGVVALLPLPFEDKYVEAVKRLWAELPGRTGNASGSADAATMARLVDHLRRTRRSGVLVTDPRTPNEGRATFVLGKLERARFLGASAQDALDAMVRQPKARWTFSEVAGSHGDGAGVVIEVGPAGVEEPYEESVGDEPLTFEVPLVSPVPKPVEAPRGQSPRMLFVDDDEAILQMFTRLFQKHGFRVTTALDGQRGLEAVLGDEYDLVLADLNMPHLDGWGMLRAMRDDFRTREMPVAFISAHDDYRESLRALEAGAQAYLSKGVKLDAIVDQTRKLLEPRDAVTARLDAGGPARVAIHAVGPQWLLRQLAGRRLTGTIEAKDGWASYQLALIDGRCVHAHATAGRYAADGERAFNAFIASKAAEGTFTPGVAAGTPNLTYDTETLLAHATHTLNDNERRLRESLMLSATHVDVNQDLYAVYQQVGPRAWLETARLICEEKRPPRDVIAHLDVSPLDVEETLKDLLRRGVVTLRPS